MGEKGGEKTEDKKQNPDMERIRRQLRKMAFGKANDCIKLALGCYDDLEKLDLSMLTEIKRTDKGGVELKLLDRTKILSQLAELAGHDPEREMTLQLLQALQPGDENEE